MIPLREPSLASAWIDHCLCSASPVGLEETLFLEGMVNPHGILPAASRYNSSIIDNYLLPILGHHSEFSVPISMVITVLMLLPDTVWCLLGF